MHGEALTSYEQKILDNVRDHGCHVTSVFDPDGNSVDYSYSAGFPASVKQPEVIVFGLPSKLAGFMVNETLRQCREGLILLDWSKVNGLIERYECIARSVPSHRIDIEHFNSAIWLERHRTGKPMTAAFQLVWPGAGHGLYPWEVGANLTEVQPALYGARAVS